MRDVRSSDLFINVHTPHTDSIMVPNNTCKALTGLETLFYGEPGIFLFVAGSMIIGALGLVAAVLRLCRRPQKQSFQRHQNISTAPPVPPRPACWTPSAPPVPPRPTVWPSSAYKVGRSDPFDTATRRNKTEFDGLTPTDPTSMTPTLSNSEIELLLNDLKSMADKLQYIKEDLKDLIESRIPGGERRNFLDNGIDIGGESLGGADQTVRNMPLGQLEPHLEEGDVEVDIYEELTYW